MRKIVPDELFKCPFTVLLMTNLKLFLFLLFFFALLAGGGLGLGRGCFERFALGVVELELAGIGLG